jgi:hypothetical protein
MGCSTAENERSQGPSRVCVRLQTLDNRVVGERSYDIDATVVVSDVIRHMLSGSGSAENHELRTVPPTTSHNVEVLSPHGRLKELCAARYGNQADVVLILRPKK